LRAARLNLPLNQSEGGSISSLTSTGKVSPPEFFEGIPTKENDSFGERCTVTFSILPLASSLEEWCGEKLPTRKTVLSTKVVSLFLFLKWTAFLVVVTMLTKKIAAQ